MFSVVLVFSIAFAAPIQTVEITKERQIDNYKSPSLNYLTSRNSIPLFTYVEKAKKDKCWNELIQRESGWKVNATNAISKAYGLPQSLPANKMATAGDDWQTNPETQLKWMKGYIIKKYGTTCNALRFQIKNNWY